MYKIIIQNGHEQVYVVRTLSSHRHLVIVKRKYLKGFQDLIIYNFSFSKPNEKGKKLTELPCIFVIACYLKWMTLRPCGTSTCHHHKHCCV